MITREFTFSTREILLLLHAKICKIHYIARICTHCTHLHVCATGKNWCPEFQGSNLVLNMEIGGSVAFRGNKVNHYLRNFMS